MASIVVQTFLTLDGVAQAPGRPDEDTDGGFRHGGWQAGYPVGELVAEWEERTAALLLGRRTYEIFAGSWGVWDEEAGGLQGELTRRYNRVPKFLASRGTPDLPWRGSELLERDLAAHVRRLRAERTGEIRVWGSTELVRTLAEHGLVDEYRLLVYPLVLDGGKRLFEREFADARLTLVESRPLASGVVLAIYRPTAGVPAPEGAA